MYLLIDNYDSFTFNLYHYLGELGADVEVVRNDALTVADILDKIRPQGVIISPGPGEPKDAGITEALIRQSAGHLPILGVCLGHQAIGEVFGGKVVRAPKVMHGKVSAMRHDGAGVFKDLPSPFNATRYHSLVIAEDGFPEDLEITARSDDGLIMGLQHKTHPVHGVQFHPESIASEHGHKILENFLTLANAYAALQIA
ncbi:anthranilate synthase component II [Iodidimonas gelatinilytica]|nr:aminodeoxychorismate/anthranilate synthase component II [Iodidimonas gelatinilytica]